jgi:hypothetical protein
MKIKIEKKNLLVNTDNKRVLFHKEGKINLADYSSVINIGDHVEVGNNVMSAPGEYEIEDILFSIFAFGENLDHPDIIFLDSNENIRVLYLLSHVDNLDKSIIEKLPEVNIVIAEIEDSKLDKKMQIVSDLEPDIFVPLVDKSRSEEIKKALGVSNIESVATLNVAQKDIEGESSELLVYLLNN